MAEEQANTVNRWVRIGLSLIIFANIVLVLMIWQTRLARMATLANNVSFITGYFAIIGGGAIGLILLSSVLIFSRKLRALVQPTWVWAWIISSLLALVLASSLIAAFSVYLTPFLFWLFIIDMGLLFLSYQESLAKMNTVAITRNALAIAFGIVLTLVMLEILLRVYFGLMGTQAQKVAYIYSVDDIIATANRYIGRPYINYGLSPNHQEHNSRGYRGAEFSIPKNEDTYRIFALGGSTTYGDSLPFYEAYPALLESVLHEVYGYTHIEVINAGVNAYSSFDSLANLTYHVLDDEPDMVIVYHGVNDVRARLVAPEYYSGANLQRGYWNPSALQNSLSPSVLLRFSSIQLGFAPNPNQFETILGADTLLPRCGFMEVTCEAVDNRSAADILAENPPIYFERNLRNMQAIANANDIDVIFSTWLYYTGELRLPNPMSLRHMQDAVDEQNALIRDLGETLDVPVIDFANDEGLDSADYWIDGMHLTALGTRAQAEFYAAYLIENDLLPPPPAN